MSVAQLELRVNGVDFSYSSQEGEDVARVRFSVTDPVDGEINASGRVAISMEEYMINPSLSALAELTRTKLIERLEPKEEKED